MEPGSTSRLLTECNAGVLTLTLNRPSRANSLDGRLLAELLDVLRKIEADANCSAVVLTGAGQNFCAGADIKAYPSEAETMSVRTAFNPVVMALRQLDKPVIAAANGAVAGGGMGLFLAADVRIMGDTARLVPSWMKLGLVPDLGVTWLLPRMMQGENPLEWLASGEPMSAQRAQAVGLASEVVPAENVLTRALTVARKFADKNARAVALTKHLLRTSWTREFDEQLELEADLQDLAAQRLTNHPKTD